MAPFTVTKASGDKEPFDEYKLRRSLKSAGADKQIIDQIAATISDMLYDGISTQRITEEAFRQLSRKSNYNNLKIPQPEHTGPTKIGNKTIDTLQRHAFDYFVHETNPNNGLVADNSQLDAPASIASVGFALGGYLVGVKRGWMSRNEAIKRTLSVLRFFWDSEQSIAPDATGYKGFYYHFLDMHSGQRAKKCELSTIDTSILLAGMLVSAAFFDHDSKEEKEIRSLSDALYRRVDWEWACNGGATVTHGWTPEKGFLSYRWEGYDEAALLYLLGLGSFTHTLSPESYSAWTSTHQWKKIY
ncbi:MAG: glucoamylase family protein, partial [Balneolaceae bacterium]